MYLRRTNAFFPTLSTFVVTPTDLRAYSDGSPYRVLPLRSNRILTPLSLSWPVTPPRGTPITGRASYSLAPLVFLGHHLMHHHGSPFAPPQKLDLGLIFCPSFNPHPYRCSRDSPGGDRICILVFELDADWSMDDGWLVLGLGVRPLRFFVLPWPENFSWGWRGGGVLCFLSCAFSAPFEPVWTSVSHPQVAFEATPPSWLTPCVVFLVIYNLVERNLPKTDPPPHSFATGVLFGIALPYSKVPNYAVGPYQSLVELRESPPHASDQPGPQCLPFIIFSTHTHIRQPQGGLTS